VPKRKAAAKKSFTEVRRHERDLAGFDIEFANFGSTR
jgi:hypothetical protein